MRGRLLAVLLAAAAALVVALLRDHGEQAGGGVRVERVVDGDTLRVIVGGRSRSVRLLGIDTPETHRPGTPVECGGPQATAHMETLAPPGTHGELLSDPGQDRVDRRGRLLAYGRLPCGRLVGGAPVEAG